MVNKVPTSTGIVSKVPCCWCREVDSLEDIEADLQIGSTIECTSCNGVYEITDMRSVTLLQVTGVSDV